MTRRYQFSAADGVGGSIKNKVTEKMLMSPDTVMRNVQDIKHNIDTSIDITIHTKADIQNVVTSMPKKLERWLVRQRFMNSSLSPTRLRKRICQMSPHTNQSKSRLEDRLSGREEKSSLKERFWTKWKQLILMTRSLNLEDKHQAAEGGEQPSTK